MNSYNVPNLYKFFNQITSPKLPKEFSFQERDIVLPLVADVIRRQGKGREGVNIVFKKIKQIYNKTKKFGTVQPLLKKMDTGEVYNLVKLFNDLNNNEPIPVSDLTSTEQVLILMILVEIAHFPNEGDKYLKQYMVDIKEIFLAIETRILAQDDKFDDMLGYWRKQLSESVPIELPFDHKRSARSSDTLNSYQFSIEQSVSDEINNACQTFDLTNTQFFLSIYSILLQKYTQQSDISVGLPVDENVLTIRTKMDNAWHVTELFEHINQVTKSAIDNQFIPFEYLLKEFKEYESEHFSLFNVMINDQGGIHEWAKNCDLVFNIQKSDQFNVQFSHQFEMDTIKKIETHFKHILQSVLDNPSQLITEIQMLSDQETHHQLVELQRSVSEYDKTITVPDLIEQQAQKTPDAIALRCGDDSMSYHEFNCQSNRLAHYLSSMQIGKGSSVGLCTTRSMNMMIALVGIIKSGASYIPMDINYPVERLKYMLSAADSELLITDSKAIELHDFAVQEVLIVDEINDVLKSLPTTDPKRFITSDDRIYTLFTSGSTGKPKGASVSHRNEVNLLNWYINEFTLGCDDKLLLMSALGFDLTQKNLMGSLVSGATLVIPPFDEYDPDKLSEIIIQEGVTRINCAPSMFYPLVEKSNNFGNIQSLKYVWLGGEPINLSKLKSWQSQADCKVVNSYGPTECTDITTYHVLNDLTYYNETNLPIGKANENVQLYILDDNLNLIPEGHIGQLCIGGDSVGKGYINQHDLTQEKFIHNPFAWNENNLLYKTGDLVKYQKNGDIEFIGRMDFQVKLRGLRIELEEIDYALQQQDSIKESITLVKDDQLVAYVVVSESYDEGSIRKTLFNFLPDYMVPSNIITLNEMPLTPNGKIDRNTLADRIIGSIDYIAPQSETEVAVASIWENVLELDQVGLKDNFFTIGGNSIKAVQTLTQIKTQFKVELSVKSMFMEPTLECIVQHLDEKIAKGEMVDDSIIPIFRQELVEEFEDDIWDDDDTEELEI